MPEKDIFREKNTILTKLDVMRIKDNCCQRGTYVKTNNIIFKN